MVKRLSIVSSARTFVGTPYHHQGRLKSIGVDCLGLIIEVAKEVGILLVDKPEFLAYKRRPPRGQQMLQHLDSQCNKVNDRNIGDIGVFWVNPVSKRPQHLALISDVGLIHTNAMLEVVVEQPFDEYWITRQLAFYEMPGVI